MSDDPTHGDPFLDPNDPKAIERERRRREREERRRRAESARPAPETRQASPGSVPLSERLAAMRGRSRPSQRGRADRRPSTAGASELLERGLASLRELFGWFVRRPVRIAGAIAAVLVLWFAVSLLQPFHGSGSGRVVVKIPRGAGVGEVADVLDEKGVISNGTMFEIRVTLSGARGDLQAGTFTLARDMSYGDAIEAITERPALRIITVTIPEGYSRAQIADLARESGLEGSYERASVRSPELRPGAFGDQGRARNLEGFLFPATYELKPGSTAADLVAQQLAAFKQRIRGVDKRYARKKNLTTYDLLIIASMIEREVAVAKERPLVAAVIYNRLRDEIPLGIDATIRFATGNYTRPLTLSELDTDSPYNTRLYAGLPPGPIGNPGLASIEAAARPAKVPYLYYVVKPDTCGEHAFSSTAAQFERDVARYNEAREAAGGNAPTSC